MVWQSIDSFNSYSGRQREETRKSDTLRMTGLTDDGDSLYSSLCLKWIIQALFVELLERQKQRKRDRKLLMKWEVKLRLTCIG